MRNENQAIGRESLIAFQRNTPAPVIALNVVFAFVLALLLLDDLPGLVLFGWVALVILVALINGVRHHRFQTLLDKADDNLDTDYWTRSFVRGTMINGIAWGIGGALMYQHHAPFESAFLLLIVSGVAAGTVASQASVPQALHSFLVPALVLPAARIAWLAEPVSGLIAALLLIYLGFLFFVGRTNHRTFLETVRLRFKNAELMGALSDRERHFRLLIENALDWVTVLDPAGTLRFHSPSVEEVLGYTPMKLEGRHASELVHPDDWPALRKSLDAMFAGQTAKAEARWKHSDGHWVLLEGVGRRLGGAETEAVVLNARDVTLDRQTEMELRNARDTAESASRMKDQFLASMSHEIRTPLHAILGMADLLQDTPLDECQSAYVTTFQKAGRHLLALLNDILDFSRIAAGQLRLVEKDLFDLNELLDGVVKLLSVQAAAKGIVLETYFAPSLPVSRLGDAHRLRQVIVNLMGNAVKFTDRGKVSLRVEEGNDADVLEFTVADTGRGIPEPERERVFEPFTQLEGTFEHQGVGLGLAISRSLVSAMGGTIHCEGIAEGGTVFRFTVKLPPAVERVVEEQEPWLEPELPRASILVVDDSAMNRMVIQEFLRRTPCEVDVATQGQEALQLFHRGVYNLILLDVQMPVMNGWELTRAIRALEAERGWPRVPIIALTAGALDQDRAAAAEVGCDGFLAKPVGREELLAVMANHLSKKIQPSPKTRVEYAGH